MATDKSPPQPLTIALRALNRREHSIAEIDAKLTDRGYEREQIEDTIAELVHSQALDDRRFAEAFATDKRELDGWGPERIATALAARGVSEQLIEQCCGADDREELVGRARQALLRRGDALDDDRARHRALGFLTRRGYEYEIAYDAIRAAARAAAGG